MLEKSTNRIDIMLMRRSAVIPVLVLLTCMIVPAPGATRVMVQDFEKISVPPTVWVVHIPNENASVLVSADQSRDGQKCLKLHYRFVGTGDFQYLGIPNKVRIKSPVHKLRFWLKGDNSKCSYGVQVSDASGETHQYSKNTGQGGIIDFAGWKEVVIDLDSGHETWGGDKNGRTDYPISAITFTVGQPKEKDKLLPIESEVYFNTLHRSRKAADSKDPYVGRLVDVYGPGVTIKHNLVVEPEVDEPFDPDRNYVYHLGAGPQPAVVAENNLVFKSLKQAKLVDTTSFAPAESSPARDAATARVDYITLDHNQRDRYTGAAADVGAVERQQQ